MKKITALIVALIAASAIHAFAQEELPPEEMVDKVRQGANLLKEDTLEEAGGFFLELIEEYPDQPLPALGLMRVSQMYKQQNQTDKAVDWLKRALPFSTRRGELHISIATLYIQNKQEDEGLKHVREAVENSPDAPRVVSAALTCYAEMGRFDKESYELAQRLLALGQTPVDANHFLCIWHEKNGDLNQARAALMRAVAVDTNNMQTRLMLGKLYEKMEKNDLAEREYIKMLRIVPHHFSGYLCLSELYQKMGKTELAREYGDRATQLRDAAIKQQQEHEKAAAEAAAKAAQGEAER